MLEFLYSSFAILLLVMFLVTISVVYNAYILRGGKLAQSQIFMALGMVSFMLSFVVSFFVPNMQIYRNFSLSDVFVTLGFVFLFVASLRLRAAFK